MSDTYKSLNELVDIFQAKASELKTSAEKVQDFVRGVIDNPEFLELTRLGDIHAIQLLEEGFGALDTSNDRWQCLMAFIQTDSANLMADDFRTDDYYGLGSVIGRITDKMDDKDRKDFHAFLPMTRAGKKMIAENPRAAQAAVSRDDPLAALMMILSAERD